MSEKSWVLARVEDGEAYWWDAGGEWWTEEKETYIREGGEDLKAWCEHNEDIAKRIKETEGTNDVFQILFTGVSFVHESSYWDLDYGWVPPDGWIEYENYKFVNAEFKMPNGISTTTSY